MFCIGLWLAACPALAHTLDLATARVTLRDDHAEVLVEADVLQLVARASAAQPDAPPVVAASDAELDRWLADAKASAEAGARMDADGARVPLVLRAFPTADDVRLLAGAAGGPHAHAAMTVLRFESAKALGDAASISVVLPESFGRVLYTFVQPSTRLSSPGAGASFPVLIARDNATSNLPSDEGSRHWLAFAAAALAIVALLVQYIPRRRNPRVRSAQESRGTA